MLKFVKLKTVVLIVLAMGSARAMAAPAAAVYLSFDVKVVAAYALLAQGKSPTEQSEIFGRATKYVTENLQKTTFIEVRNFAEFLENFRGEWPNAGDLETDLKRIESQSVRGLFSYTSKSPSVLRKIEEYRQSNKSFLLSAGIALTEEGKGQGNSGLQNLISKQIENFNKIGEKVASSGMAGMKDAVSRIVLQTLFSEYYARQSLDSKKQMIMSMLNADLMLTDEAKLELMIQNSGPQFQKLLQVVARQGGLDAKLQATFKILESAVRAEPWWKVEAILKQEKNNFTFTYFERKPLGVGTMAQVHRAKVLWNGQSRDVVARFIKPGIELKVIEDHRILTEVANIIDRNAEYRQNNGPLMTPLVQDITDTVRAELDQDATIERQITAKKVYDVQSFLNTGDYKNMIQFKVPEVLLPKSPSRLMVQEMVIGKSLDKEALAYKDTIPGLKKGIVEAMAKVWAQEVMFGTGFYHSDLHQGNFLVRVTDGAIVVTILDFGMGGVLNEKMRRQVMLAGVATAAKDIKLISDSFWDMSEKSGNKISQDLFRRKVQAKLKQLSADGETLALDKWIGWVSDQGLKIPYDLINLSRGTIIMNNSLHEVGSTKDIGTIEEDLAKRYAKYTFQGLKATGLVSNKELAKAGYSILTSKFAKPIVRASGAAVRCELLF
ncbi:MAG: AarF/ABC1/UbiB kinase family protein [Bdellovibrionaceae bacterium]|nr:AarF/ABC1/UbiB kinase family protein [Pseudobdellovibrionaceae bacterium]